MGKFWKIEGFFSDLLCAALAITLFIGGVVCRDFELFQRLGAIIVLLGALLSLRAQKRSLFGNIHQIQASLSFSGKAFQLIEKKDDLICWSANQLGYVITQAGSEPPWGPDLLKPIELTEEIHQLASIQIASPEWLKYQKRVELFGTTCLWVGTLVWAFGDTVPTVWKFSIFHMNSLGYWLSSFFV